MWSSKRYLERVSLMCSNNVDVPQIREEVVSQVQSVSQRPRFFLLTVHLKISTFDFAILIANIYTPSTFAAQAIEMSQAPTIDRLLNLVPDSPSTVLAHLQSHPELASLKACSSRNSAVVASERVRLGRESFETHQSSSCAIDLTGRCGQSGRLWYVPSMVSSPKRKARPAGESWRPYFIMIM